MQSQLPPLESTDWQLRSAFFDGYLIEHPQGWEALVQHAHRTEARIAFLQVAVVVLALAVVVLGALTWKRGRRRAGGS